jgi:DNA polymerase III delta subunit
MLYIFLGPDDYTKKQEIKTLVKNKGADLVVYEKSEDLPQVATLLETDLFSKPKVFVLESFMPDIHQILDQLLQSQNFIIISINALDKRKTENKALLANPKIITKQFNLPHKQELNQWIAERVKALGGSISNSAVEELAVRLGRDNFKETKYGGKIVEITEVYNLWQVNNEIEKLIAYAGSKTITEVDVQLLIEANLEIDAFEITNAIGEGNKSLTLALMAKFIGGENETEEKSGIIHLNALLAEQMRNLLLIQNCIENQYSDTQILDLTGWKSGRIFILKKLAQKIKPAKILGILPKFEALDEELKTSQTPPRVLWDLIVAQIF